MTLHIQEKVAPNYIDGNISFEEMFLFLSNVMQFDCQSDIVDSCIALTQAENLGNRRMIHALIEEIKHEEEGSENLPVLKLAEDLEKHVMKSRHEFLDYFIQSYLEKTRDLTLVMTAFSKDLIKYAEGNNTCSSLTLFCRDCLFLWPAAQQFSRPGNKIDISLLQYSRKQMNAGLKPLAFRLQEDKISTHAVSPSKPLNNTCMIDVGLYGSLIHELHVKTLVGEEVNTIFLASRNPFITGWLNVKNSNTIFQQPTPFPEHIISIVDSIEALLKPYRIISDIGGQATCIMGSLLSIIGSAVLLREIWKFSGQVNAYRLDINHDFMSHYHAGLGNGNWGIHKPVTRWDSAEKFISKWQIGPLAPMNEISGISL